MENNNLVKVPLATLSFWLIKILSTTVGETVADYLATDLGYGLWKTTIAMLFVLTFFLILQFKSNKLIPSIYWINIVLVSIVGTQLTDILTDKLDVSLYLSSSVFTIFLIIVFSIWFKFEGTLSIDSISTQRREFFYWITILVTFALGTATGDLSTESLGLGFKLGTIIYSILILLFGVLYYIGVNSIFVFWSTYILTRPLGAALGDFLTQSREYGGLGFGAKWTSMIFLLIIIFMLALFPKIKNYRLLKI